MSYIFISMPIFSLTSVLLCLFVNLTLKGTDSSIIMIFPIFVLASILGLMLTLVLLPVDIFMSVFLLGSFEKILWLPELVFINMCVETIVCG